MCNTFKALPIFKLKTWLWLWLCDVMLILILLSVCECNIREHTPTNYVTETMYRPYYLYNLFFFLFFAVLSSCRMILRFCFTFFSYYGFGCLCHCFKSPKDKKYRKKVQILAQRIYFQQLHIHTLTNFSRLFNRPSL